MYSGLENVKNSSSTKTTLLRSPYRGYFLTGIFDREMDFLIKFSPYFFLPTKSLIGGEIRCPWQTPPQRGVSVPPNFALSP